MPKCAQVRPSAPKRAQVRPSSLKHSEQLLGTYGNLLNLKQHEIFDLKKTSYGKKERRTKQSLDLPQTIEANKKVVGSTVHMFEKLLVNS